MDNFFFCFYFVFWPFGSNAAAGFDQIAWLNTSSGEVDFIFYNLMENMIGFQCDMETKACDASQTSSYDPMEKRVYFQATQFESADDTLGTTVLLYVDLSKKTPYIDTGLSPFSFGFMDFQFVQVVQ